MIVSCEYRIRLGYQQAVNTFKILLYAFVTSDNLQSSMLASRASLRLTKLSQNIQELNSLLPDVWWEGVVGERLALATARVEQLGQLQEALRYAPIINY